MNKRIAIFTNGFSNEFIEHIVTGLQKKAKEDCVDIFDPIDALPDEAVSLLVYGSEDLFRVGEGNLPR